MSNEQIIKEEIGLLLIDLKKAYEKSGKKVSGEFATSLEAKYSIGITKFTGVILGYTYLAGRKAGKRPPLDNILSWVKEKGIFSFKNEQEARGIAFAIQRKIGEEGTTSKYHFKIYQEVITPRRINSIIDKVTVFNVNSFIESVSAELKILEKNV